jgi:lipopolysaccharide transport system ATP-binding protein
MAQTVINITGLSKRFIISHEAQQARGNFREMLSGSVKSIFTKQKNETITSQEEFWALRDVTLEIKQGDCIGIVGRNGAGKSTLLKILSRITEPTAGRIDIEGRVASLLEVGTGFHPELTGRENIFLNGAILGMSRAEIRRKFDEIVAFAEVDKFLDTPVKRYSSGMYVRLAFAVAAHLEPEILVIDEVLAVGDAQFQRKCLGKMEEVSKKEGKTVLFVSHQMGAIRDLCNTAVYLKQGQVCMTGSSNEVVKTYLEETLSTAQSVSLGNRTDRKGTGLVTIKHVFFYDRATMRKIDTIISGDDIIMEIGYTCHDKNLTVLNNVVFGCAVHTRDQQFITPFNNRMADRAFDALPPEGSVYCQIEKFPLMFGEFSAHLGLLMNNELIDYVENGCVFKVEEGDFFKSNTNNAQNRQGVYIPQKWSARIN